MTLSSNHSYLLVIKCRHRYETHEYILKAKHCLPTCKISKHNTIAAMSNDVIAMLKRRFMRISECLQGNSEEPDNLDSKFTVHLPSRRYIKKGKVLRSWPDCVNVLLNFLYLSATVDGAWRSVLPQNLPQVGWPVMNPIVQGPIVESIVSLTSSLMTKIVNYCS